MKKRIVAAIMAAVTAFSMPLSASAAWKKDVSGSWKWLEGSTTQTGWKWISGKWYSFDSQGIMTTGWLKEGNTWYYLEQNGAMKTGWLFYNGTWYYLRSNGAMATGWQKIDGVWYYFKEWGGMATGWVTVNGKRYFLASSGAMQTGIIEVDGNVYYFGEDGASVTGKVRLNGKTYTFAETGEAAGWRKPQPDKAFDSAGKAAEITVSGGYSGGGSTGGGGSSSGGSSGGTGGGTGGGSESGDKAEIRVDNGYWEDTEEGLKFNLNDGYYMLYDFGIQSLRDGVFKLDSVRIESLSVRNIFGAPSDIRGEIRYFPEGVELLSSNRKSMKIQSASLDDTTGILTLQFMDLDVTCVVQLKIAADRKSVTLVGVSSKDMSSVRVGMTNLPNTTRTVKNEQEIRDALADKSVTKLVVWGCASLGNAGLIKLDAPLVIDRDIEFSDFGSSDLKVAITSSENWKDENSALFKIENGATVTLKNFDFYKVYNGNVSSLSPTSCIEVNNSSLRCEGVEFHFDEEQTSPETLIIADNSLIELSKATLYSRKNGIRLDSKAESSSSLKIVDTKFDVKGKLIVSNSANTTVVLPGNFVEFTNAEGQREWTDDASKIPAAE